MRCMVYLEAVISEIITTATVADNISTIAVPTVQETQAFRKPVNSQNTGQYYSVTTKYLINILQE